jgi:hypothetical protein
MGDRLQTGEPYKGLAGAAVSPVLIASWGRNQKIYAICVTRGFMGPLGGFWPKLGRKRVTGWKQRSCVPPGRVKTNKQIIYSKYCCIRQFCSISPCFSSVSRKHIAYAGRIASFLTGRRPAGFYKLFTGLSLGRQPLYVATRLHSACFIIGHRPAGSLFRCNQHQAINRIWDSQSCPKLDTHLLTRPLWVLRKIWGIYVVSAHYIALIG